MNRPTVITPSGIYCIYLILILFCQADEYTWLTYQEVGNRIDRLALGLHSMGLRSGDKVMIYADTCAEWLIMAMACFKSSLTIVTIYTNLGKSGVSFSINQVLIGFRNTRLSRSSSVVVLLKCYTEV